MEYRGLYDSGKYGLIPIFTIKGNPTECDTRLCEIVERLRGDKRLIQLVEILINNVPR